MTQHSTATNFAQLCLQPEAGCDGPGLASLLRFVAIAAGTPFAAINDVDIIGGGRMALEKGQGETLVISCEELTEILVSSAQIVWSNVFLCQELETANQVSVDDDYTVSLRHAAALVRVVDATYYYVYGPAALVRWLHHDLDGELVLGDLNTLEFPE